MQLRQKIVIGVLYYFYQWIGIVGLYLAKLLVQCPEQIVCCNKNVGNIKVVNVQLASDKVGLLLDYTNRATLILKYIWDNDIKGGGFNITKLLEYVEPFHVLYIDYLTQTGQLIKKEVKVEGHQASINGKNLNFNNVSFGLTR